MLCKRTALYLHAENKDPGHNSLSSQCREVAPAPLLWFTVGRDTPTDTSKTGVEGKPGSTGSVRCSGTMGWAAEYLGGFVERRGAEPEEGDSCQIRRKGLQSRRRVAQQCLTWGIWQTDTLHTECRTQLVKYTQCHTAAPGVTVSSLDASLGTQREKKHSSCC